MKCQDAQRHLDGVRIRSSAHDNVIGGKLAGAGNKIASGRFGIAIEGGSFAAGSGNAISGNSIFSNTRLGIDLEGGTESAAHVTENDDGDSDPGPNTLQNYPVLSSAISDGTTLTIAGTFNSLPLATFRLEFFGNSVCHPSGFGEGEMFLGSMMVTTDDMGDAMVNAAVTALPNAVFVTATATSESGSTSEFSNCIAVSGVPSATSTATVPESTATPTDTVIPTPTDTPPSTMTPDTPVPTTTPALCVGDCSDDGAVTVDEVVTLVNIALGIASSSTCSRGLPQGASVDVTLIIQAIDNALDGCA